MLLLSLLTMKSFIGFNLHLSLLSNFIEKEILTNTLYLCMSLPIWRTKMQSKCIILRRLPPVTETWISCRQDSVQSHDKHYRGNWVEETAGKEAHSPWPTFEFPYIIFVWPSVNHWVIQAPWKKPTVMKVAYQITNCQVTSHNAMRTQHHSCWQSCAKYNILAKV